MLQGFKNEVAQELGYPNWEEYYNWICRESQNNMVVAQQIESAMIKVMDMAIDLSVQMAKEPESYDGGKEWGSKYYADDIKEFIHT